MWTEADWSDEANPVLAMMPYIKGKTLAEQAAWEFVKQTPECGFRLDSVLPSMVVGPTLQPTLNASTGFMKMFVDGSTKTIPDQAQHLVDVRDVALAHLAVYEKATAEGEGQRHICLGVSLTGKELCEKITSLEGLKDLPVPTEEPEGGYKPVVPADTSRLAALGCNARDFADTLRDTVGCYREKKLI